MVDTWTTRGRGLAAVVMALVGVLLAGPAVADAASQLNLSPGNPQPNQPVTIFSTWGATTLAASSTIQGADQAAAINQPPTKPTLTANPAAPGRGQTVQITAAATDPEGTLLSYAWDFDNDGLYDDATGAVITRVMPNLRDITSQVRVTDADGGTATSDRLTLTAPNRAPVGAFTISNPNPAIGETVTYTDTSTDPDGDFLTRGWDTDGDGFFDNGRDTSVTATYTTAGARTVRLYVDDGVASSIATRTVTVRNLPPQVTLTTPSLSVPTQTLIPLTLTASDPDGGPLTYAWDLDGDGAYDDSASATPAALSFPRSGARTLGVRVTDNDGAGDSTVQRTLALTIQNRPPTTPVITPTPASVDSGAPVKLRAVAADPEGTALTYSWDLVDDGVEAYDDATGQELTRTMPASGSLFSRVRASDADGGGTVSARFTLFPNNGPPVVTLAGTPETATVGEPVTFTPAATDPDSDPLTYAWDLDNDGEFDDRATPTATLAFATAGGVTVRVRVHDGHGHTTEAALTLIVVDAAPPTDPSFTLSDTPPAGASTPPAPPATKTKPKPKPASKAATLLRPFPRVRIRGRLTRRGARFTGITVTAPRGSRIEATCRGGGCPKPKVVATAGRSGVVRLSGLLGSFRSGARIIIRVTKAGTIGKHTAIVVRRNRAPKRTDLCLKPRASVPTRCPAN